MLYKYNGKIYIKPFINKIVEVDITKKDKNYDVKPAKEYIHLTPEIREQLVGITLEEAYKEKNKKDLLRNS